MSKDEYNGLIYDAETKRAVLGEDEHPVAGIQYAKNWGDYEGMGISCLCAYDLLKKEYRIFMGDNMAEFQKLVNEREMIIGFNSIRFDDKLLGAHGIDVTTTYDLSKEAMKCIKAYEKANYGGRKLPPKPVLPKGSYKLHNFAELNLGYGKDMSGALAPLLYQQGRIGELLDYCLKDVRLTKNLMSCWKQFITPYGGVVELRSPMEIEVPAATLNLFAGEIKDVRLDLENGIEYISKEVTQVQFRQ